MQRAKNHLGVWMKDRWRYERALRGASPAYLALANRHEQLEPAPDGLGQACLWQYTSRLHAPGIQPHLAQRLLRRCLADAPIGQGSSPSPPSRPTTDPDLSVLIGHRGLERLPLLLATLKSLASGGLGTPKPTGTTGTPVLNGASNMNQKKPLIANVNQAQANHLAQAKPVKSKNVFQSFADKIGISKFI
jgi:hypothetical protein